MVLGRCLMFGDLDALGFVITKLCLEAFHKRPKHVLSSVCLTLFAQNSFLVCGVACEVFARWVYVQTQVY